MLQCHSLLSAFLDQLQEYYYHYLMQINIINELNVLIFKKI